jgi:PTS system ascorbate-specific IIA component
MIGILLITHDTLGESLIQCVSHVLNKRPQQILQLGLSAGDDPKDLLPLARQLLKLVDSGEGVLVITDIYGASPSNLAAKLLQPGKVEGLAGASVPMLLRAINYRDKGMEMLLTRATSGGRDGVLNMLKH